MYWEVRHNPSDPACIDPASTMERPAASHFPGWRRFYLRKALYGVCMADGYNEKSCSALEKPYYKPIEAALRWCNLIQHEEDILRATGDALFPGIGAFPQWHCLRANAEHIVLI